MDNLDNARLFEIIEEQEKNLVFQQFNLSTACEIGNIAVSIAKEKGLPACIAVYFGEFCAFKYAFPGTGLYNDQWMARKNKTARVLDMPSLKAFVKIQQTGEDLKKDWFLDPMNYSIMGGAFPIRIDQVGMVGMICVSGLPHLEDHQLGVDSIAQYLKANVPSVLGS